MKQVSQPPFLGIGDDKKWCPFFIRASEDPIFCIKKRPFSVIWGAKKWVFGRPNKKTDTTFCCQLYPKMVDETLVSYEYHYWVSFGQFLKIAYFRLIFGRFPLIKSQNQNPMARSVKYEVWNLEFFFWTPNTQRQQVLRGRVTKKYFAF